MSEAQNRYVDYGSVDRGESRFQKTLSFWRNFQFAGGIGIALGVLLVLIAVNEHSHLDLTGMSTIALIGLAVVAASAMPWVIGRYVLERFKYEDFDYRIALHFMREMKIQNPAKVLAQNPHFLEAFEEIRTAVTAKQAEYGQRPVDEQLVTRLAYRIASLMLRGESSLALKPNLLSLIAGGADLDYDSLAETLNRKLNTSSRSRSYVSYRP
jgi:hypothetical protein